MKYQEKLRRLNNRRSDEEYLYKSFSYTNAKQILNESYKNSPYPDSIKYILGSMNQVNAIYTQNIYKQGERVKKHLEKLTEYDIDVVFRYQGSVTNNTHIKTHSDIDLLVIIKRFFSLEPPLEPLFPYQGNVIEDLLELRKLCDLILNESYTVVDVDNTGTCSIALSGGSLKHKVDVVPANWYETLKYRETKIEDYKGIMVLDKNKRKRRKNFPFLNNLLIDEKDKRSGANFRKSIRLLKTLKVDSARNIDISSYDIIAILYYLDNDEFNRTDDPLIIVKAIKDHLLELYNDYSYFEKLEVPDNSRKISDKVTKENLAAMIIEIDELMTDVINDLDKINLRIDNYRRISG